MIFKAYGIGVADQIDVDTAAVVMSFYSNIGALSRCVYSNNNNSHNNDDDDDILLLHN
jgi:hypothetical protein